MTDRELLERAAKAEGHAYPWVLPAGFGERLWNPLTDDGDALRLAVKLRIHIRYVLKGPVPCVVAASIADEADCPLADDPTAATRRAIVRAAAAMAQD